MVALAAQRKKRGYASSAIAISSLLGIGYVERSENFDSDHFTRIGYKNMSEQDYLQLFAEGIVVGKPDNTENSEIATGLSPTYYNESVQAQFRSDPKFAHFILEKTDGHTSAASSNNTPVRTRLAHAKSQADVAAIIKQSFDERLKRILQLPEEEIVSDRVTLVEQGVDSTMAVDVRTWFLKELDIDISVLKILRASATIKELVDDALQRLPPTMNDLAAQGVAQGVQATVAAESVSDMGKLEEPTPSPSAPKS